MSMGFRSVVSLVGPILVLCGFFLFQIASATFIRYEQGDSPAITIMLIHRLLQNNLLLGIPQTTSLSTLLPSPEPYTLLDFFVYIPSKKQEINCFEYTFHLVSVEVDCLAENKFFS